MSDERLLAAFQSADVEVRLSAVEQAAQAPTRYAKDVVDLIPRYPDEAYFILERIGRFGESAIPHLEALENSTEDADIRLVAVLCLAHFRRRVANTVLLDAIRCRSKYQFLACRALAWLGDSAVLPILLEELRVTSAAIDEDMATSLESAISDLGGTIPPSERERLAAERLFFMRREVDGL
jgi:hypothetical protein